MTERNNIQLGEGSESNVPHLLETIHSCTFCCVQEIDPGLKTRDFSNDLLYGSTVIYRGLRVLDGASNGCAFFTETLSSLESILSAHGYEQGSASPNFRPENWIYELFFSHYTGYLETAREEWRCAKGELMEDTQQPQQEQADYLALAYQGTRVKKKCYYLSRGLQEEHRSRRPSSRDHPDSTVLAQLQRRINSVGKETPLGVRDSAPRLHGACPFALPYEIAKNRSR